MPVTLDCFSRFQIASIGPALGIGGHYWSSQGFKLFSTSLISQWITRIALGIVELLGKLAAIRGLNVDHDPLECGKHFLDARDLLNDNLLGQLRADYRS